MARYQHSAVGDMMEMKEGFISSKCPPDTLPTRPTSLRGGLWGRRGNPPPLWPPYEGMTPPPAPRAPPLIGEAFARFSRISRASALFRAYTQNPYVRQEQRPRMLRIRGLFLVYTACGGRASSSR